MVVVGAGLAGLACATELAEAGHVPLVLEAAPRAGGRVHSFLDRANGLELDNGQHVLLAACTALRAWLARLGGRGHYRLERLARVPVLLPGQGVSWLGGSPLAYRHLSLGERVRAAAALAAAALLDEGERRRLDAVSFGEWLSAHGQSERAVRRLWDPLVVATLNLPSSRASAALALFVVRSGLLRPGAARLGLPRVGLSRLAPEAAQAFLGRHGGEVRLRSRVVGLELAGHRVRALLLAGGEVLASEACVLALPHHRLSRVLPPPLVGLAPFRQAAQLETSPIVNVHLVYDRPVLEARYLAVLESPLQWVFARGPNAGGPPGLVTVSLSAADRWVRLPASEVQEAIAREAARVLPGAARARLLNALVVKEPHATYAPAPGAERLRSGPRTGVGGLYLAGAWTATGWPATMEGAVRSGLAAAREVLRDLGSVPRAPGRP
ncbi:MAG: FAD-dependent oxidoreductase [Planctomycetes bacterium]|nr:FAD-dependent oxidoreductase [Planctomycetota bacterium]